MVYGGSCLVYNTDHFHLHHQGAHNESRIQENQITLLHSLHPSTSFKVSIIFQITECVHRCRVPISIFFPDPDMPRRRSASWWFLTLWCNHRLRNRKHNLCVKVSHHKDTWSATRIHIQGKTHPQQTNTRVTHKHRVPTQLVRTSVRRNELLTSMRTQTVAR